METTERLLETPTLAPCAILGLTALVPTSAGSEDLVLPKRPGTVTEYPGLSDYKQCVKKGTSR